VSGDAIAMRPVGSRSGFGGNRRQVMLVAVLGVLAVLFIATRVLGGGGSKSTSQPSGVTPPAAITRTDGTPAAPAASSRTAPATAPSPGPAPNTVRDPFKAAR
jgi:hypothetical protein